MSNLRRYGNPPFRIALIHGGPGAPGEMAPLAGEIASVGGVLEPLQSALTIEGEIEELAQDLKADAGLPAVLVGYSWGAWLGFMLAARYPALVSKLILIGAAPFTPEYAVEIDRTRFNRLNPAERSEVLSLKTDLDNPGHQGDKNALMARAGEIFARADSFDPLPHQSGAACRWDIFASIWPEAAALRQSGALFGMGKDIRCPVVAIHGDYDPHPAAGVSLPLAGVLNDFRFILLPRCGHTPWFERQARAEFYEVLKRELEEAPGPPH